MTPLPTATAHMAGHIIDWLVNRPAVECVEIVSGDGYWEERPNFRAGFEGDEGIIRWYCTNFMCGTIGERVNAGVSEVVRTAARQEGNWFRSLLTSEHDENMFLMLANRSLAMGEFVNDLLNAEQAIRDYLWRVNWEQFERALVDDGSVKVYRSDLNITVH